MRRFAKLVLHHQILVVVVWVVLAVAGVISIKPVNDRLTIDFFLPGQPGTQAARQIISDFGNGGSPSPYLVVFTAPDGQSVTGHKQVLATAFTSVATAAPNLRLVDEATSGNKVFRSKDDRTFYAMVFYNRGNNPSARPPTPLLLLLITMAKSSAPSGWTKGVTGEDVVSAGDSSASGPGVLGETLFGALGALLVLPVPFMRSVGIGGALIPLASVLTTLTLTPAILSSIGPKVDWPKVRHESQASPLWSRWAAAVVRRRWVAAGASVLALGVLIVAFSQIKIGLAGSKSLATKGPAFVALSTLEKGGEPTGTFTPLQVLTKVDNAKSVAADLAKVDGITDVIVATDPGNVRNGRTVVIAIPSQETVNSKSVGPVKSARSVADSNDAILGIAGPGADQIDFLHAVYGKFPLMLSLIALLAFVLLARAFRSVLSPLKAVLLNLLTLAGDPRLRGPVLAEGIRLGRDLLGPPDRRRDVLGPDDGLRLPVRAVDGLRGVHPRSHPGGVRRARRHDRQRCHRGHRADRAAGDQCGSDLVPRLRRAVVRTWHRPQAL